MSQSARARLIVEVDLDPVPGWGNDPGDWQAHLQLHLANAASHYHPVVTIDAVIPPTTGGAS